VDRRKFLSIAVLPSAVVAAAVAAPVLAAGAAVVPDWNALSESERQQVVNLMRAAWDNGPKYPPPPGYRGPNVGFVIK
jgi:hypothetical protein